MADVFVALGHSILQKGSGFIAEDAATQDIELWWILKRVTRHFFILRINQHSWVLLSHLRALITSPSTLNQALILNA